jgi:hypothetical protein
LDTPNKMFVVVVTVAVFETSEFRKDKIWGQTSRVIPMDRVKDFPIQDIVNDLVRDTEESTKE